MRKLLSSLIVVFLLCLLVSFTDGQWRKKGSIRDMKPPGRPPSMDNKNQEEGIEKQDRQVEINQESSNKVDNNNNIDDNYQQSDQESLTEEQKEEVQYLNIQSKQVEQVLFFEDDIIREDDYIQPIEEEYYQEQQVIEEEVQIQHQDLEVEEEQNTDNIQLKEIEIPQNHQEKPRVNSNEQGKEVAEPKRQLEIHQHQQSMKNYRNYQHITEEEDNIKEQEQNETNEDKEFQDHNQEQKVNDTPSLSSLKINKSLHSSAPPSAPLSTSFDAFSLLDYFLTFSTLVDYETRYHRMKQFSHRYEQLLQEEFELPEPFNRILFVFIVTLFLHVTLVLIRKSMRVRLGNQNHQYRFNTPDFTEFTALQNAIKKINIEVQEIQGQTGIGQQSISNTQVMNDRVSDILEQMTKLSDLSRKIESIVSGQQQVEHEHVAIQDKFAQMNRNICRIEKQLGIEQQKGQDGKSLQMHLKQQEKEQVQQINKVKPIEPQIITQQNIVKQNQQTLEQHEINKQPPIQKQSQDLKQEPIKQTPLPQAQNPPIQEQMKQDPIPIQQPAIIRQPVPQQMGSQPRPNLMNAQFRPPLGQVRPVGQQQFRAPGGIRPRPPFPGQHTHQQQVQQVPQQTVQKQTQKEEAKKEEEEEDEYYSEEEEDDQ